MKRFVQLYLLAIIFAILACNSAENKAEIKNQKTDTPTTFKPESETISSNNSHKTEEELKEDTLRANGITKILFPHFTVKIPNFKVYDRYDLDGNLKYSVDSGEVKVFNDNKGIVSLKAKRDTVHLTISIYSTVYEKIEIIPKHKNDQFFIDFSYDVGVHQIDDEVWNNTDPNKKFVGWNGMTNYQPLINSTKYTFKLPSQAHKEEFLKDDVRKKISVKDTTIVYHREYDERAVLIYKGKPCSIGAGAILFRIKRSNNGELLETKFVNIDLPFID